MDIDYPEELAVPNLQEFDPNGLEELNRIINSPLYKKYVEHILASHVQGRLVKSTFNGRSAEEVQLTATLDIAVTRQLLETFYALTHSTLIYNSERN